MRTSAVSFQSRPQGQKGFTLLEVMMALGIAALVLVQVGSVLARNITDTEVAQYSAIAADLARFQILEIEEELLHEGFQDTDQEWDGDFKEQGWPQIRYRAIAEKSEFPTAEEFAQGGGGLTETIGGIVGDRPTVDDAQEEALAEQAQGMLGTFMPLLENILIASMRKVSLTVEWDGMDGEEAFVLTLYVYNANEFSQAMSNSALGLLGSFGGGGGTGSGGGSGDGGGRP